MDKRLEDIKERVGFGKNGARTLKRPDGDCLYLLTKIDKLENPVNKSFEQEEWYKKGWSASEKHWDEEITSLKQKLKEAEVEYKTVDEKLSIAVEALKKVENDCYACDHMSLVVGQALKQIEDKNEQALD